MRTIICVNTKWQKEKRKVKSWNNQFEVEAQTFFAEFQDEQENKYIIDLYPIIRELTLNPIDEKMRNQINTCLIGSKKFMLINHKTVLDLKLIIKNCLV